MFIFTYKNRKRERCNIYDQDHSWVSAGHIVFYKARSVSDASDKIDGVISRVFVQLFLRTTEEL